MKLDKFLNENHAYKEKYEFLTDDGKRLLTAFFESLFQPIKEIEYRHCTVDGKKALFHMWAETENVLLKVNALLPTNTIRALKKEYETNGYITNGFDTEKIKSIQAIVEYEDGTVDMVAPNKIVFCDGVEFIRKIQNISIEELRG